MLNNEDVGDNEDEIKKQYANPEKEWRKKSIRRLCNHFERVYKRESGLLKSGLKDLDMELEYLGSGNLAMIIGEPSVGKSGLAGGIFLKSVIQSETAGVLFSSEYTNSDQLRNLVFAAADCRPSFIKIPSKTDLLQLKEAMVNTADSSFALRESYGLTAISMRQILGELKKTLNIQVVVIDSLDYLRARSEDCSPLEVCGDEILMILHELKGVAKSLDLLVLFTMNDFGEYSASSRLRHAINQNVDMVFELSEHRNEALHGDDLLHALFHDLPTEPSTHLLRISKNKTGPNLAFYCEINSRGLYSLSFPEDQCVYDKRGT